MKKGNLWIAKFPSKNDSDDVGFLEMLAYTMATKCGINMAESKAQKFRGRQHTFLTKRFDRTPAGQRIHFASAMTLLGYSDGADASMGVSYLELVDFITQNGADVKAVLSPAYDINPVELGSGLKLNISENDNTLDFNLALEVAPLFRIDEKEAKKNIMGIIQIVANWRAFANQLGISRAEQEMKATAFNTDFTF